jgi:hypothetical protein
MTTAQREIRNIRRELIDTAADPFEIAAEVLAQNNELRRRVAQLEQLLER